MRRRARDVEAEVDELRLNKEGGMARPALRRPYEVDGEPAGNRLRDVGVGVVQPAPAVLDVGARRLPDLQHDACRCRRVLARAPRRERQVVQLDLQAVVDVDAVGIRSADDADTRRGLTDGEGELERRRLIGNRTDKSLQQPESERAEKRQRIADERAIDRVNVTD